MLRHTYFRSSILSSRFGTRHRNSKGSSPSTSYQWGTPGRNKDYVILLDVIYIISDSNTCLAAKHILLVLNGVGMSGDIASRLA